MVGLLAGLLVGHLLYDATSTIKSSKTVRLGRTLQAVIHPSAGHKRIPAQEGVGFRVTAKRCPVRLPPYTAWFDTGRCSVAHQAS